MELLDAFRSTIGESGAHFFLALLPLLGGEVDRRDGIGKDLRCMHVVDVGPAHLLLQQQDQRRGKGQQRRDLGIAGAAFGECS